MVLLFCVWGDCNLSVSPEFEGHWLLEHKLCSVTLQNYSGCCGGRLGVRCVRIDQKKLPFG